MVRVPSVTPAPVIECVTPSPVIEYVAPASAVTCTALSPVIEYMAPAPAVTHEKPAPVIETVAPAPTVTFATPALVIEYITPAPSVTHVTPSEQFSPAYTMGAVTTCVSSETTSLVNPQGSFTAVEASASQVVGSVPTLDVFTAPVRQEQIVAEQDRVQRRSLEPDVHAPVLLIQVECGRCQSVPEDSFLELLMEQIVDASCPQGVEEVMYATVNELIVAAPADELAPDVELDASIRCCLGRAHRPRAPSRRGRGATVSGGQPDCKKR